jgi:hypothetical protein
VKLCRERIILAALFGKLTYKKWQGITIKNSKGVWEKKKYN